MLHRILQIPGDHCLFLKMQYKLALCAMLPPPHHPWSRCPFEKSSTAASPNSIPLTIFTRMFPNSRLSPHPISRPGRHPLFVSGNPACCAKGNLASCNFTLAYRRAVTVMRGPEFSTLPPSPGPVRPQGPVLHTPTCRQAADHSACSVLFCARAVELLCPGAYGW